MKLKVGRALLLVPILLAAAASAKPPGSAPPHAQRAPQAGPDPSARRNDPAARDGRRDGRRERFGGPAASGSFGPPAGSAPHGHRGFARGALRAGAMAELAKALRSGEIKREDLASRLKELREAARDRRKAHVKDLRSRFSAAALRSDAFREEFKLHARRMALLNRSMIVAQTDLKGDARSKALARIDRLVALENERHDKAVATLQGAASAPSSSALAVNSPPAASAQATTSAAASPPAKP